MGGSQSTFTDAAGNVLRASGDNLSQAFINSFTVTIPAVIIPILIAAAAAFGFAWMIFPGRKIFFTIVVALLVVPLQIALIPILRDYMKLGLTGSYLGIWLAHTGFGLPLGIYLLYNYISTIPRDVFESAFLDGARPMVVFARLVLPLSVPAIASLGIFQFLWVWNDLLVALVFLGGTSDVAVLTQRLANMGRFSWSGLAFADCRSVRRDGRSCTRVFCTSAILCTGTHGRISQGVVHGFGYMESRGSWL